MRAVQEQHDCQILDFAITDQYVEYTERQTKNRQGDDGAARERARKYNNKIWRTDGGERDPYRAFVEYASHRPQGENVPPNFFLAPIGDKKPSEGDVWFKASPVGRNTLAKQMKIIATTAGLDGKYSNSSGRKTVIQSLRDDFHPLEICELTGHANPESISSYSHNPLEKQRRMSNHLAGFSTANSTTTNATDATANGDSRSSASNVLVEIENARSLASQRVENTAKDNSSTPFPTGALAGLFSDVTFNNSPITISINLQSSAIENLTWKTSGATVANEWVTGQRTVNPAGKPQAHKPLIDSRFQAATRIIHLQELHQPAMPSNEELEDVEPRTQLGLASTPRNMQEHSVMEGQIGKFSTSANMRCWQSIQLADMEGTVLPISDVMDINAYLSPIIVVDGFEELKLSKPVTLRVPHPCPAGYPVGELHVFFFKDEEWTEITETVESSEEKDSIELRINHFSKIWLVMGVVPVSLFLLYKRLSAIAQEVCFAAFKLKSFSASDGSLKLTLWCMANHMKNRMAQLMRDPDSDEVYTMKSNPRGLIVIINIEKFSGEELTERTGSQKDVDDLVNLFCGYLNFEVRIINKLRARELMDKLMAISDNEENGKYDCLAVCIMSHGNKDFFFAADEQKVKFSAVYTLFSKDIFRAKPKLFFIQACRGTMGGPIDCDGPNDNSQSASTAHAADCNDPDMSDIVIAYPSFEGYSAHRHLENGSFFIQSLLADSKINNWKPGLVNGHLARIFDRYYSFGISHVIAFVTNEVSCPTINPTFYPSFHTSNGSYVIPSLVSMCYIDYSITKHITNLRIYNEFIITINLFKSTTSIFSDKFYKLQNVSSSPVTGSPPSDPVYHTLDDDKPVTQAEHLYNVIDQETKDSKHQDSYCLKGASSDGAPLYNVLEGPSSGDDPVYHILDGPFLDSAPLYNAPEQPNLNVSSVYRALKGKGPHLYQTIDIPTREARENLGYNESIYNSAGDVITSSEQENISKD
ncbi:hypothetical protein QZH41_007517 [Actinostola sp. cb2023]|nr:hypothetical protein QZH41_007517 [Actinostola sp. cb2023]